MALPGVSEQLFTYPAPAPTICVAPAATCLTNFVTPVRMHPFLSPLFGLNPGRSCRAASRSTPPAKPAGAAARPRALGAGRLACGRHLLGRRRAVCRASYSAVRLSSAVHPNNSTHSPAGTAPRIDRLKSLSLPSNGGHNGGRRSAVKLCACATRQRLGPLSSSGVFAGAGAASCGLIPRSAARRRTAAAAPALLSAARPGSARAAVLAFSRR